ncbi:unnamed protein product [Closterium sp. Naga37s-1]|nr:unnamed protein product [Closterium sp. Naga37s-1]
MTAPLSAAQWQARVTFHAPTFVIGVVTGVVLLFVHQHLTSTVGGIGGTPPAAFFRNYYDSNGDNSTSHAEDAAGDAAGNAAGEGRLKDGLGDRGGWNGGGDVLPGLMAARHVGYNTSAGVADGKLNVHLVVHSHDDIGWLSTVDQCRGEAASPEEEQVAHIIDSVVANLEVNPHRKFVQVEQGFFYRWWQQQSDYMRARVKTLVANHQLQFTNGGWVMHDEACVHYTDMLHQMSLGHRFLKREFNAVPRITWQVDPFGHSATQGYLLTAQAGMDAVFVGRVDIKEGRRRKDQRTSEFLWRASQTFGRDAQVFTGILDRYTYYPPELFKWEAADDLSLRVKDNLWSSETETNVKQRVDTFVKAAFQQAASYRTDHIMWTMGEDFSHTDALPWFSNLDKLIHYVNLDGRVNVLYSTPAMYVDAKHRANETWPTRTGDMFPYDEYESSYWTGYFSSRPSFKYFARLCSSLLLASTAAEALVGRGVLEQWGEEEGRMAAQRVEACEAHEEACPGGEGWRRVVAGVASTARLEDAVAIAQHHDAITGTAKQHVNDDYSLRLHAGAVEHHDAITGTAKQHVNDDYSLRLHAGAVEFTRPHPSLHHSLCISLSPSIRLAPPAVPRSSLRLSYSLAPSVAGISRRRRRPGRGLTGGSGDPSNSSDPSAAMPALDFALCPLLNISFCPPSQLPLSPSSTLVVVAYNPLAWARSEIIRFPVASAGVEVRDAAGRVVAAQIVAEGLVPPRLRSVLVNAHAGVRQPDVVPGPDGSTAVLSVVFEALVPPLGYASFFLSPAQPGAEGAASKSSERFDEVPLHGASAAAADDPDGSAEADGSAAPHGSAEAQEDSIVLGGPSPFAPSAAAAAAAGGGGGGGGGGAWARVSFSRSGYGLAKMELMRGDAAGSSAVQAEVKVSSNLMAYSKTLSGAYLFRPMKPAQRVDASNNDGQVPVRVVKGPLLHEFHRTVAPSVREVFRVYPGKDYAELHYMVGMDEKDAVGKEYITRFDTAIQSNSTFYTDSNGRDYMTRVRNYPYDATEPVSQPIAGNYYPLTCAAHMGDPSVQLSVLVDRALGASSLADGQLEVMLHRRLQMDDGKGVAEVLKERICVNGGQCEPLSVVGSIRFALHPGRRKVPAAAAAIAAAAAAAGADAATAAATSADANAVPNTDGSPTAAVPSGGGGKEEWQGGEEAAQWRREHAQRLLTPLQLAFAVESKEALAAAAGRLRWSYSLSGEGGEGDMQAGGQYSLPPNVAVISMQELSPHHLLLRLAHLYEAKEHPSLSTMASVPLRQLFASRQIISFTELSLTANQKKADMRPPMAWREESTASAQGAPGEVSSERPVYGAEVDPQQLVVELGPFEIRTFALTFKPFSA